MINPTDQDRKAAEEATIKACDAYHEFDGYWASTINMPLSGPELAKQWKPVQEIIAAAIAAAKGDERKKVDELLDRLPTIAQICSHDFGEEKENKDLVAGWGTGIYDASQQVKSYIKEWRTKHEAIQATAAKAEKGEG